MAPTQFMCASTKATYLGQELGLVPQLLGKHHEIYNDTLSGHKSKSWT